MAVNYQPVSIITDSDRTISPFRDEESGCIILGSPTNNCQIAGLTKPYNIFRKDKAYFDAHILEIRKKSGMNLLLIDINIKYANKLREWRTPENITFIDEYVNDREVKMAICLFKIR